MHHPVDTRTNSKTRTRRDQSRRFHSSAVTLVDVRIFTISRFPFPRQSALTSDARREIDEDRTGARARNANLRVRPA